MTDLVKRLRERFGLTDTVRDMHEAADEIERLSAVPAMMRELMEEARKVVGPFANGARVYPRTAWDSDHEPMASGITVADLARAAELLPRLTSALAQEGDAPAGWPESDVAAKYLAETVMRYAWDGLRKDGRAAPYPAWTVGGHANARQEDYRDAVRRILALAAVPAPRSEEERDWPEDFADENGNYINQCCMCLNTFKGYKRRVVCKACASKPAPHSAEEPPSTRQPEPDDPSVQGHILGLRERIAELEAGREWQPIEAGQMDGALILAGSTEHETICVVGWTREMDAWSNVGGQNAMPSVSFNRLYFNRWRPLPSPPTV